MFKSILSSILFLLVCFANINWYFAVIFCLLNLCVLLLFNLTNNPVTKANKFLIILLVNCLTIGFSWQVLNLIHWQNLLQVTICMFGFSLISTIIAFEKIRINNQILIYMYCMVSSLFFSLSEHLIGTHNMTLPILAMICMNLPYQSESPPHRQTIPKRKIG